MSRRRLIEAAGVRALIDDVFQISCTVFYFVETIFHISELIFRQQYTGMQENVKCSGFELV